MEGKIFSESSNIYQDQAKILFDYYKAAAEKIVSQEIEIEEKITQIEEQITTSQGDESKFNTNKLIGFIVGGVAAVAAIVLFILPGFTFYAFVLSIAAVGGFIIAISHIQKLGSLSRYIASSQKELEELDTKYQDIFRDYRVEKLGVAYIPVASRVSFNDKSFLVDHTGSAKSEKFTLQILRQNQLINSSISELRKLTQEAPIVEDSNNVERVDTGNYSRSIQSVNFHDYFGKLDRTLRTISYCLSDKDETTVELPVIYPDTSYAKFLADHATSNTGANQVFNVFNTAQYNDQIDGFRVLNETRKSISSDAEEVDLTLRHLMVDMATSVQTTSAMKVSSVGSLIDYSNRIMFNILKAPYNFYSPVLEAEEIERIKNENFNYGDTAGDYKPFDLRESSRMRFDLISMCWVDESGAKTIAPFGVSQIQSEIMAPIVSNLLKETRKERIDIYSHINDQKIDFLNQWHRDTDDFYGRNRAESNNLINLMRANLTEYTAAYNTLVAFKNTEENMRASASLESAITEVVDNGAEVLMAYQKQSEQFRDVQSDFEEYMLRLHDDIDLKATKFGHVEYYDASLRDEKSRDAALAVDNVCNLEERRKPLAEVTPLLAQVSDLPPAPSVEDITYEHVGLNLMSMAQEAIEDLDMVVSSVLKHEDSLAQTTPPIVDEDFEEDDDFDEDDDFEDENYDEEEDYNEDEDFEDEDDYDIETDLEEDPGEDPEEDSEEQEEEDEEDYDIEEDSQEEIDEQEEEVAEPEDDIEDDDETKEIEEEEEEKEESPLDNYELKVGSELYDIDENGEKLYYDDGEYNDDDNALIIVVKGGRVIEIRPLTE